MILLRIIYVLCLLLLLLLLMQMFKDFNTLPDGFIGKGSLAWGIIFAVAWFIYLLYKVIV